MKKLLIKCSLILLLLLTSSQPAFANYTIDSLTNETRAELGLKVLNTPEWLWILAKQRARAIYFDFEHNFSWSAQIPGCVRAWGENIMYRIPAAENPAHYAWRAFWNSPDHHELMVGKWTATGSAVFIAPNGGQYVAQLFILRCR